MKHYVGDRVLIRTGQYRDKYAHIHSVDTIDNKLVVVLDNGTHVTLSKTDIRTLEPMTMAEYVAGGRF